MAQFKDMAIVLRRLDYSETSQVLAVLTRQHGLQRLIAKGIKRGTRRRVAVGLDLLELGQVVFSQRPGKEHTLATMMEWRQDDSFPHLRRDLTKCYAAQYAAEVTSLLTEPHDPHPALFDGFVEMLRRLGIGEAPVVLVRYLWLMLTEIGLRPELERCVNCRRALAARETLYFSSRLGGAICRDCESAIVEKRRIDARTARRLAAGGWEGALPAAAAFDLLDYHLRETLSRSVRVSSPLRAALGWKILP